MLQLEELQLVQELPVPATGVVAPDPSLEKEEKADNLRLAE